MFDFLLQGPKACLCAGTLFFRFRPPEGECFAPHLRRGGSNSMPGGYTRAITFEYMMLNDIFMRFKISHIFQLLEGTFNHLGPAVNRQPGYRRGDS